MQANVELSRLIFDPPACGLRVMCGPRYNAFAPEANRREAVGQFFQTAAWKAMSKPRSLDDDADRWDGLE